MSSSQWGELNQGMWRSHGGFELAVTPVLFGLFGFWLDSRLDLVPVFTIVFVVVAFAGVVAKHYYTYRFQFDRATAMRKQAEADRDAAASLPPGTAGQVDR